MIRNLFYWEKSNLKINNDRMKRALVIGLFLIHGLLYAQNGKLLLVGGGMERSGSSAWNYEAYLWAVDQSENKKVAIIGHGPETDDWLRTYFVETCHAVSSMYFDISSVEAANVQATCDAVSECDVIFFKGGDQRSYYLDYKNTRFFDVVKEKYNSGGVIAGTSAGCAILSDIVYTAEASSINSADALKNIDSKDITLKNDFFQFSNGFLFDTHFAERGRFGRLIGFLANWYKHQGVLIAGIGIDDLTALSIDENKIATAYGTGAANLYFFEKEGQIDIVEAQASIRNLSLVQLLNGQSVDLITMEKMSDYSQSSFPEFEDEVAMYTIFASGSDINSDNKALAAELIESIDPENLILIVTGESSTLAIGFKYELEKAGASNIKIFQTKTAATDTELENSIEHAEAIVVMNASWTDFKSFIQTSNGTKLLAKMRQDQMVNVFLGDNARFIGPKVILNYKQEAAAYYNEMDVDDGLGLLKTTIFMPNTFVSDAIYENTACALPYVLFNSKLSRGIWLDRNYVVYKPEQGKAILRARTTNVPVIIQNNPGTFGANSSQTSSGSTSYAARMISGFDKMYVDVLLDSDTLVLGKKLVSGLPGIDAYSTGMVYPNPVRSRLFFQGSHETYTYRVYSLEGKQLLEGRSGSVAVSHLQEGLYVLIYEGEDGRKYQAKFLKK